MALVVGELVAYLGLDDKDYTTKLGKAGPAFDSLVGVVAKASAAVAVAAGAAVVAVTKMAMDFQTEMANTETLLGAGFEDRIKEMGQEVKNLSVETGKDLKDLSGGLYQVVSAFGDTADSSKILGISAKAASAGLATTTDAINLIAAHTKGYGDTSAEAAQKAADLAFETVKLGQTTFPELAAVMGRVIPLAATLKIKEEELYGAMATLTGVTGNTAEVSTQLKAVLQSFVKPTEQLNDVFTDLGYASASVALEQLGMEGALKAVSTATGGSIDLMGGMFGSVEALGAVLALTGPQAENFTEKTRLMGEAAGSSTEAFEIQQKTVSATMARMKQAITVVAVELGEQFLPIVEKLLGWVQAHMPEIQAFMTQAFDVIKIGFSAVGDIIDWFMGNVIGPMYEGWETGNTEMQTGWQSAAAFIGDTARRVFEIISTLVEIATVLWNEWGDDIMYIVEVAWNAASGIITGALKLIQGVLDVFIGLFTGDWDRMGKGLLAIWDGFWEAVAALFEGYVKIVNGIFKALGDGIMNWFKGLASDAYSWGTNVMQGFSDGLTGMFAAVWNRITTFVDGVKSKVKEALGINSPSTVFREIGANVGEGMALGLEDTENMVQRAAGGLMPSMGMPGGGGSVGGPSNPMTVLLQVDGRTLAEIITRYQPGVLYRAGVR